MRNRMIYQVDETRSKIDVAARKLFTDKGLFDVQMKDIAHEAGVSRNTLYRYYQDKSELALAIAKNIIHAVFEEHSQTKSDEILQTSVSGWLKLKQHFSYLWVEANLEEEFRFLAEFDAFYTNKRLSDLLKDKLFDALNPYSTQMWRKLIEEGIADDSIRSDRDIETMLSTLINSMRGLNQRILLRGDSLKESEKSDHKSMLKEFIEIYFDGLKK